MRRRTSEKKKDITIWSTFVEIESHKKTPVILNIASVTSFNIGIIFTMFATCQTMHYHRIVLELKSLCMICIENSLQFHTAYKIRYSKHNNHPPLCGKSPRKGFAQIQPAHVIYSQLILDLSTTFSTNSIRALVLML